MARAAWEKRKPEPVGRFPAASPRFRLHRGGRNAIESNGDLWVMSIQLPLPFPQCHHRFTLSSSERISWLSPQLVQRQNRHNGICWRNAASILLATPDSSDPRSSFSPACPFSTSALIAEVPCLPKEVGFRRRFASSRGPKGAFRIERTDQLRFTGTRDIADSLRLSVDAT